MRPFLAARATRFSLRLNIVPERTANERVYVISVPTPSLYLRRRKISPLDIEMSQKTGQNTPLKTPRFPGFSGQNLSCHFLLDRKTHNRTGAGVSFSVRDGSASSGGRSGAKRCRQNSTNCFFPAVSAGLCKTNMVSCGGCQNWVYI